MDAPTKHLVDLIARLAAAERERERAEEDGDRFGLTQALQRLRGLHAEIGAGIEALGDDRSGMAC